jgi:CheY-like chemotaxis protein
MDNVFIQHQEEGDFVSNEQKTLLLIEDSPSCRILYQKVFLDLNFQVETFSSCTEAESRIKNGNHIDFIALDLRMSEGIDGLSFARKYRHVYPMILMSADKELLEDVREEGFITVYKGAENTRLVNKINRAQHDFDMIRNVRETKRGLENLGELMVIHQEETKVALCEIKTLIEEKNKPKLVTPPAKSDKFDASNLLKQINSKSALSVMKSVFSFLFTAGKILVGAVVALIIYLASFHPTLSQYTGNGAEPSKKPEIKQKK